MLQDTKPKAVKRYGEADLRKFGPGEVDLFDFVWTDYLWSELKAGKSWPARLKNSDVVVVAVLEGELEVLSGKGDLVATVRENDLFASHDRILRATVDSKLFAAPLFAVIPLRASSDSNGDRGGPVFI